VVRTVYPASVTIRYRPVQRLGAQARCQDLPLTLEVAIYGPPSPAMFECLTRSARVIDGQDLTRWFDEPVPHNLAEWLWLRVAECARANSITLARVTVVSRDMRCDRLP
jgi:hypothetical protein